MQHEPALDPRVGSARRNGNGARASVVGGTIDLVRQEARLAVLHARVLGVRASALVAWAAITAALVQAAVVLAALTFVLSGVSWHRLGPMLATVCVAAAGASLMTFRAWQALATTTDAARADTGSESEGE